jgi:hypothetical protein
MHTLGLELARRGLELTAVLPSDAGFRAEVTRAGEKEHFWYSRDEVLKLQRQKDSAGSASLPPLLVADGMPSSRRLGRWVLAAIALMTLLMLGQRVMAAPLS